MESKTTRNVQDVSGASRTGEINQVAGLYRTDDCGYEQRIDRGNEFPPCPKHHVKTDWYLVSGGEKTRS